MAEQTKVVPQVDAFNEIPAHVRKLNDGEMQEYLQVAQGIAELDRGESVDLDEVLEKAHAIVDDIESKRFGR